MAYHTVQKQMLRDFLQEHTDTAFTVEEIAAALTGPQAPGKSTVYRLITQLVDSGAVKRFVRGNSRQFVYQAVGCAHSDAHLHLKCVDCGQLLHLDDAVSSTVLKDVLTSCAFRVDEQQTVLFGHCAACGSRNTEVPYEK